MSEVLLLVPPHLGMNGLPLGLASLGTYLLSVNKAPVHILDMANDGLEISSLRNLLPRLAPDVSLIGITATTPTYRYAWETAQSIKSVMPGAFLVLGGIHPSYCYESILQNHPEIDCVVRGEGELALSELIEVLEGNRDLSSVGGVSYRSLGRITNNPPRPLIPNLDILPYDYERVIDRTRYRAEMFDRSRKTTSTIVGRGCSFRCTFCSEARRFGPGVRMRSVENVLADILALQEQGFGSVYFEDDVFTINRRWISEFCEEMRRRHFGIEWHCETRVDLVDEGLLRQMKLAGCRNIFFGIESMNQSVLDRIQRGIKVEEVREVIHICDRLGIDTFCSLQIGLPGETYESIHQSIREIAKLPITQIGVAFTSAYPGTQMFQELGFPLDIYERYREPDEITDWFARSVGHGVNSVHPFFMDWKAYKSGEIVHDFDGMKRCFAWCQDGIRNLWTPFEEIRPAHSWRHTGKVLEAEEKDSQAA